MSTEATRRTTCRVCNSSDLTHLFSLGAQYVSDFVTEDKITTGPKVPINLQLCNNCTLVQQEYTAPQDFLYTRHYWYKSGTTDTMKRALAEVVDAAMDCVQLKPGNVVLDIGSNDGTLLRQYPKDLGLVTVGVEPANNFKVEGAKGISVLINDFWSEEVYDSHMDVWQGRWDSNEQEPSPKAKIITAIGMFYDLEDPNAFIADVAKCLHPNGVFVAQLMCLKQTIQLGDVGNFTHEHLEFYSLRSLVTLFSKHGLVIVDIFENKVNGGSYRLFIKHKQAVVHSPFSGEQQRVDAALDKESGMQLSNPDVYKDWFTKIQQNMNKVRMFLLKANVAGKKTWVYGASTKGNVILQFLGLNSFLVEAAADKSEEKHGKHTVGSGIEIMSDVAMRIANPDYLLLLPYAFVDEFVQREIAWFKAGGTFILPLPTAQTIKAGEKFVLRNPL